MSQNLFPEDLCCSLAIVPTNPSPDAQCSFYLQIHVNSQGKKVNLVSLFSFLQISYLTPVILLVRSRKT